MNTAGTHQRFVSGVRPRDFWLALAHERLLPRVRRASRPQIEVAMMNNLSLYDQLVAVPDHAHELLAEINVDKWCEFDPDKRGRFFTPAAFCLINTGLAIGWIDIPWSCDEATSNMIMHLKVRGQFVEQIGAVAYKVLGAAAKGAA